MAESIPNKTVFISFLTSLLLMFPTTGGAGTISIGGTVLEIPNPPGFVVVTPEMRLISDAEQQSVVPEMERFFSYIAESEVPRVLNDELPELPRVFTVLTARSASGVSVSKSDFSKIKQAIKTRNHGLFREVEGTIPGLLENVSKGIINQSDVDPGLAVSQAIPLPPHEDTDRRLAFSELAKMGHPYKAGNPTSNVLARTSTVILVKGKVLFLYSYAESRGLTWTREASKQWADSIVSANPSDDQPFIRRFHRFAAPFERIAVMCVVGVVFGLISWLVGRALDRRKPH